MRKTQWLILAMSGTGFVLLASIALASTTGTLLPTSDGNYLQWTPSTGTTHYTLVDESSCNGTTDYVSTNTTSQRDSYGVSLSSLGNGSVVSQIAIIPCASRNSGSGGGSSTLNVFYRYNGSDSSDTGSYALSGTTPTQLATSTYASLNLFKTSTSTLEVGAIYSAGTRGARLSRIATVLTYTISSPSAPTSLSATNYSSTQNDLTWTDNASNELGYRIYRAMDGGSYALSATTTWDRASYSDTGLTADHTYSYKVVAYNDAGTATSNIATAITYNSVPPAPTLSGANYSSTQNNLSWTDASTNEDGFQLWRAQNGGSHSLATTTVANTTAFNDTGLTADQTYSYKVAAFNVLGSATSSIVNVVTYNTAPTAPSGLNAVAVGSDVSLTWNDNSTNEDYFFVERSLDGSSFSQIATTTLNLSGSASYTDTGAASGSYYYRVRAKNTLGYSSYSNTAAYNIPTGPDTVNVYSNITSATTWGPTHVYVINGSIQVSSGALLTIEAGTIVKFSSTSSQLIIYGSGTKLDVQGTTSSKVFFTSVHDDIGNDTDGTSIPTKEGNWDRIEIDSGATATLTNAVVRYGGCYAACGYIGADMYVNGGTLSVTSTEVATSTYWGIYQQSGSLTLGGSNIHISDSNAIGVYLNGGNAVIQGNTFADGQMGVYGGGSNLTLANNTFTNHSTYAVGLSTARTTFTHWGNSASGGPLNGIVILGFNANETLTANDMPYIIQGGLSIPQNVTIIVQAGAVVKFDAGSTSGLYVAGTLNVQGDEASPVYLTSIRDDVGGDTNGSATPANAGDWNTIRIGGSASLDHAIVRYGGHSSGESWANLYVYGGTLTVSDSNVGYAYGYGIMQMSGTSHVSSTAIHDNGSMGIAAYAGSLDLTDSSFANNPSGPIYVAPGVTYTHSGNSMEESGTQTSNVTWSTDYVHVVSGTFTVTSGITLSIDPGTVVKFMSTSSKMVVDGTLRAIGSPTSTIYFTSYKDDTVGGDTNGDCSIYPPGAGNWDTIQFNTNSSSTISYATVRYGGYVNGSSQANILNNGGDIDIEHVEIASSVRYGVYQYDGTTYIEKSFIHDNKNGNSNGVGVYLLSGAINVSFSDISANDYGLYLDGSYATISHDAIHGNISYGLYNNNASQLTAQNNWWGCWKGPLPQDCDDENGICGDNIYGDIAYDPWHHVIGEWAVRDAELKWYGSTQYTDAWNGATSTWSSVPDGVLVPVSKSDSATTANVVISDATSSDPIYSSTTISAQTKIYPIASSTKDSIMFNPTVMNALKTQHEDWQKWHWEAGTHELGHVLGLGHSDPITGNVMYTQAGGAQADIGLGDQDISDYNYLWKTMSWVLPQWWPK